MDTKYTEVPGALFVAIMLFSWVGVFVAGVAQALLG